MSEKFPDPEKPTVERRLYSLYPKQIQQLKELAKAAGISQSNFLRELIETSYVERILQKKETPTRYGTETQKF